MINYYIFDLRKYLMQIHYLSFQHFKTTINQRYGILTSNITRENTILINSNNRRDRNMFRHRSPYQVKLRPLKAHVSERGSKEPLQRYDDQEL